MIDCPICDRPVKGNFCSCGWIEDRKTPIKERFSAAHRPFVREVPSVRTREAFESGIEALKRIVGKGSDKVLSESEREAMEERLAIQQEESR